MKVPVDTYFPDAKSKSDKSVGKKASAKSVATKKGQDEYIVKSGDTLSILAEKFGLKTVELAKANGFKDPSCALIKIGQKLKIPSKKAIATTKKGDSGKKKSKKLAKKREKKDKTREIHETKKEKKQTVYIVKSGDTLSILAEKFGLKTVELAKANGFKDPSCALIKIGQKLKIPSKKAIATTKKGDSGKKKSKKLAKKREKKDDIESVVRTVVEKKELIHTVKRGDTLAKLAHRYGVKVSDIKRLNSLKRSSIIRKGQKLKIVLVKKRELIDRYKKYKVANGDTLFTIARKNHLLLKDLMQSNGLGVSDLIRPGQILRIPLKEEEFALSKRSKKGKKRLAKAKKKKKENIYKVRKGDSLWIIAKRNGLSIKELREINGMKKGDVIRVGMSLKLEKSIPKEVKSKKIKKRYVVRSGDTLWKIAKRYKTTIEDIRKSNGLKRGAMLRKGMKLTLLLEPEKSGKKKIHSKKSLHKRIAKKRERRKRRRDALAALEGGNRASRASNQVIRTAKRYLGKRYVWGAEGPNKFDCSGFTQYVMKKSKGVTIPRISRKQAYYGKYVSRKNLKPGDLIFFDTSRRRRGYVNHVGIYIGNNKFIHASSARHRVVITSLNRPFYRARFKWGRRIN